MEALASEARRQLKATEAGGTADALSRVCAYKRQLLELSFQIIRVVEVEDVIATSQLKLAESTVSD